MVRADIAFHDAVFAAARHRRLQDAWGAIRCQVHLLLTRIGRSTEGYLGTVGKEHQELVGALRQRDRAVTLDLFTAHRQRAVEVVNGARD